MLYFFSRWNDFFAIATGPKVSIKSIWTTMNKKILILDYDLTEN